MALDTNLTTNFPDYTEHFLVVIGGLGGPTIDLMHSTAVGDAVVKGQLCSVDPTTKSWVPGLAIDQAMPCFAQNNSADEDIANHEYGFGKGMGVSTIGTPFQTADSGGLPAWLNAYVAIRGYEIATTEYAGSTFKPQDLLVPDDVTAGKVKVLAPASYDGSQSVVGQVSRGLVAFDNRKALTNANMLTFWTRCQLPTS